MTEISVAPWAAIAGLLGLIVGSFLNVVIHRLPRMLEAEWRTQCAELAGSPAGDAGERYNLLFPPSHCPSCRAPIRPWQNIPLISFALLRGRCRHCRERISWRYPLVEAAAGVLAALVIWKFGPTLAGASALVFAWTLLALSVIDLDTQLLPDALTLPLIWLGLLVNLGNTLTPLPSAVVGAVVGYLVLWSVYWAFRLLTGKEGMGYGDFKLLAAIGAWLGWSMLPLVILASSFVGAVVGITMMVLRRHTRGTPMPFGPYLAAAGLIGLLWGTELTGRYLALFPG
ncbi:MAG TPA: A24 family peptidase [Rhodocyclaceae bacterium]